MTTFHNAAEVKSFLKRSGFTAKVSVRIRHNPFGGQDLFSIMPKIPQGVAVVSKTESGKPTHWFTDDNGKTAAVLNELVAITQETNAIVG